MILDNCDFIDDSIKLNDNQIEEIESSFDLDEVNYDISIDHAIIDLQNIIDSLQKLKQSKNNHGYIRYNVTTRITTDDTKSVRKSVKGKVML